MCYTVWNSRYARSHCSSPIYLGAGQVGVRLPSCQEQCTRLGSLAFDYYNSVLYRAEQFPSL